MKQAVEKLSPEDLIEAVAVNPKEVLINGKAAGETSLIIWQEGGNRLLYDLTVRLSPMRLDAVLHLSLSADVTVTGKRTFANLADVENPAENLVGIAQSASQGAITARQLDERPLMRAGHGRSVFEGSVLRRAGRLLRPPALRTSTTPTRSSDRLRTSRWAAKATSEPCSPPA